MRVVAPQRSVRGRRLAGWLLAACVVLVVGAPAVAASNEAPHVVRAVFVNDVNPVTRDFLLDAIAKGERDRAAAVVIEMDTPGGLSSSMRDIVKAILAADVPVVVYVSPSGASADSAGAVIGQAADVLAMAPQTNIGSSTPIAIGGEDVSEDLRRKIVNDAAAYIGELAREHGRNQAEAEKMVRLATNLGARDALARNVVDVVAADLPTLLQEIDGRVTKPKGLTLQTAGASVETVEMSWWKRALDVLIDPTVIQLMLSIGLIGIVVELWNPGLIFPGTVGAISLILALFGLQVLPVSAAGVLLVLLAFAFFAAEPFVQSHGALAVGGAVLFVLGGLILFDPAGATYEASLSATLAIGGTLAVLLAIGATRVARARRAPPGVTSARVVGCVGEVRSDGRVFVEGEIWRARTAGGERLVPGDRVVVEDLGEDLALVVASTETTERT
jgi:membrane-bound serine protease (ClpP class)